MLNRRRLMGAFAVASALAGSPVAEAMPPQHFSQSAFAAAEAANKPILLHITAPWCPTCKAQKPILAKLEAEPKFKKLIVLDIDFDSEKAVLRRFHVVQQSTLIAFKGDKEVGRSTGDTDPTSIEALLGKTL